MALPRVLILRAPGTNCDVETAWAFEEAGAVADRLHINRLLEQPKRFADYQILCIPGGFCYGDDIAAGKILANQLRNHLADSLRQFVDDGKLVLGICNGFQVLIKAGQLLDEDEQGPVATLTWNDCGKFTCRWVDLRVEPANCVFLAGISSMSLPVAHAEGRFVVRDAMVYAKLQHAGRPVMRYAAPSGFSDGQSGRLEFPANPNGSVGDVAGVCNATGRVLGLMPHPERHIVRTQHPQWTRRSQGSDLPGDGLAIFMNAVKYFS
jgi:phosphoribosylformylglycinamidine synthase